MGDEVIRTRGLHPTVTVHVSPDTVEYEPVGAVLGVAGALAATGFSVYLHLVDPLPGMFSLGLAIVVAAADVWTVLRLWRQLRLRGRRGSGGRPLLIADRRGLRCDPPGAAAWNVSWVDVTGFSVLPGYDRFAAFVHVRSPGLARAAYRPVRRFLRRRNSRLLPLPMSMLPLPFEPLVAEFALVAPWVPRVPPDPAEPPDSGRRPTGRNVVRTTGPSPTVQVFPYRGALVAYVLYGLIVSPLFALSAAVIVGELAGAGEYGPVGDALLLVLVGAIAAVFALMAAMQALLTWWAVRRVVRMRPGLVLDVSGIRCDSPFVGAWSVPWDDVVRLDQPFLMSDMAVVHVYDREVVLEGSRQWAAAVLRSIRRLLRPWRRLPVYATLLGYDQLLAEVELVAPPQVIRDSRPP